MLRSCIFMFLLTFTRSTQLKISDEKCIVGLSKSDWQEHYENLQINDDDVFFFMFLTENVKSVTLQENMNHSVYIHSYMIPLTNSEESLLYIEPSQAFKIFEKELNSEENFELKFRLRIHCSNGEEKELTIHQPIKDLNTYTPEFREESYEYTLPMPLGPNFDITAFGKDIIACDYDITNIKVEFTIYPQNDFHIFSLGPIDETNKCHKATIRTNTALRLTTKKTYYITVTDSIGHPKHATVPLYILLDEQITIKPNPWFERSYYNAIYNTESEEHYILVNSSIRLEEGCNGVNMTLLDIADYFEIKCIKEEVIVKLTKNLPDIIFKNKPVITITLQATLENAENVGKTLLVVYLPKQECSATSTSNSLKNKHMRFSRNNYWFQTRLSYRGLLGVIRMSYPQSDRVITYNVVPDLPFIMYNSITGQLLKIGDGDVNIHNTTLIAKLDNSTVEARTEISIRIISTENIQHSIKVLHVEEKQPSSIILPCSNFSKCIYSVEDYYPKLHDSASFLHIHDGNFLEIAPIDRHLREIKIMMEPQLIITFKLLRETAPSQSQLDGYNNSVVYPYQQYEWVYLPDSLVHNTDKFILTLIVDDVNDNPPIFVHGKKLVVGYPAKELSCQLRPSYLTKVVATDDDVGINSEIAYSTKSRHFIIHPSTGIIYPCHSAFNNNSNLLFNVTATDQNGKGHSTNLEVEVRLLTKDHVIFATFINKLPEEVYDAVEKLSQLSGIAIKNLTTTMGLFPKQQMLQNTTVKYCHHSYYNSEIKYFTVTALYGFGVANNIVPQRVLKEVFDNYSTILGNFAIKDWKEGLFNSDEWNTTTIKGSSHQRVANRIVVTMVVLVGFALVKLSLWLM